MGKQHEVNRNVEMLGVYNVTIWPCGEVLPWGSQHTVNRNVELLGGGACNVTSWPRLVVLSWGSRHAINRKVELQGCLQSYDLDEPGRMHVSDGETDRSRTWKKKTPH